MDKGLSIPVLRTNWLNQGPVKQWNKNWSGIEENTIYDYFKQKQYDVLIVILEINELLQWSSTRELASILAKHAKLLLVFFFPLQDEGICFTQTISK